MWLYHVLYLILLHLHRTSWDWPFHALGTHSSPSHSGGLTHEVCFLLAVHVHSESMRGNLSTWSCMMLASRIGGGLLQKLGKRDQSIHPHGLSAFHLTKGTLLISYWPEQCDPLVRVVELLEVTEKNGNIWVFCITFISVKITGDNCTVRI